MPVTRRVALAALLLFVAPASAPAQTQRLIDSAVALYNDFQMEAARPVLRNIISSEYVGQVSTEQKVQAYKYLGASYAVLGFPDTAITFFIGALEYDPFTDLDPAKFSPSELGPFNVAKQRIFKVGIKPIRAQVLDPRQDSTFYRFELVATHRANLTVEIVRQGADTTKELLYSGSAEGPRDLRWSGFMTGRGRLADTATYQLRVIGTSSLAGQSSSREQQSQFFRVEHSFEILEDTLPTLPDSMLMQTRILSSAPWFDLAKGVGLAVAAVSLPMLAYQDNRNDFSWQLHSGVTAGAGVLGGIASLVYRSKKREIPQNLAENNRRQAVRTAFNDGVRSRNQNRLDARKLIITPVTGAGR